MPSQDVWKFTPVSYRTSALWGRCPALTPLLQVITPGRASGTADHVRSLDDLFFLLSSSPFSFHLLLHFLLPFHHVLLVVLILLNSFFFFLTFFFYPFLPYVLLPPSSCSSSSSSSCLISFPPLFRLEPKIVQLI